MLMVHAKASQLGAQYNVILVEPAARGHQGAVPVQMSFRNQVKQDKYPSRIYNGKERLFIWPVTGIMGESGNVLGKGGCSFPFQEISFSTRQC